MNKQILSLRLIWILFFSYTTCLAILFQQVVVPFLIPSLNAGHGLLSNDSIYFHNEARLISETIIKDGWGSLSFWGRNEVKGNVSVLGALYALFGPNPSLIIPINASLHASTGLLIILIGQQISNKSFTYGAELWAASLFIIFPSGLNWFGQVHKDGYAILGFFLIIYSGLKIFKLYNFRDGVIALLSLLFGLALTAFVRPTNFQLFLIIGFYMALFSIQNIIKHQIRFIYQILFIILITIPAFLFNSDPFQTNSLPDFQVNSTVSSISNEEKKPICDLYPQKEYLDIFHNWKWVSIKSSTYISFIPSVIDSTSKKLSNLRLFLASSGVSACAKSMIDLDSMPNNLYSLMTYLPRASLIGLFAPFPSQWLENFSLIKFIGIFEIFIWYLFFPGLLLNLWYQKNSTAMWWLFLVSFSLLTAESYITANLGTLHRIRYPFLFILILYGCVGWAIFDSKYLNKKKVITIDFNYSLIKNINIPTKIDKKKSLLGTKNSLITMIISIVLLVSLFFRDILLARLLGFGHELDSYQLASAIPLMVASVLAVPLGPVLLNYFIKIKSTNGNYAAANWISSMSSNVLFGFVILSFLTGLFTWALSFYTQDNFKVLILLPWLMAVVGLSGSVVLGNAVLLSCNNTIISNLAALAVPASSILVIVLLGPYFGGNAAAFGLFLGQLINFIIVTRICKSLGFSLKPFRDGDTFWRQWIFQYIPLIATTALVSTSIPIGVFFASQLSEGSVSAFSLGAKIIQSCTLVISAGLVSVLLPYFSKALHDGQTVQANKSLELILIGSIILVFPFTLLLYLTSDFISHFLFYNINVGNNDINKIASVIRYTSLQLPFYTVLAILIKYTVAGKNTTWVFISAAFGQAVNFLLSMLLVNKFGLTALALSITLSMFSSSLILLLCSLVKKYINLETFIIIFISWALFISIIICFEFDNYSGIIISLFSFLALSGLNIFPILRFKSNELFH
jgi:peptidoglycan biosynthesis protein MviN/MurJ (putative lipid II flippase)